MNDLTANTYASIAPLVDALLDVDPGHLETTRRYGTMATAREVLPRLKRANPAAYPAVSDRIALMAVAERLCERAFDFTIRANQENI